MAQDTPNHGYSRPDKGEEDWHLPLNQNFEDIDADVEVRDIGGPTEGSNDYDPAVDARTFPKYLDRRSGIVYFGVPLTTGAEWTSTFVFATYSNVGDGPLLLGPSDTVTAGGTEFAFSGNAISGQLTDTTADVRGAVIGGGGGRNEDDDKDHQNTVTSHWGTVGGGSDNQAGDDDSNLFSGRNATVAGGFGNTASGVHATVAGGLSNTASGGEATVPGGWKNVADGDYSLAAGREAKTDGNDGAFVWGDSSDQQVKAGSADEFKMQAGGGAVIYSQSNLNTGVLLSSGGGSWSSLSTRTAKTNVDPVDPAETLEKVEQLEVSRWEYDSDEDAEHMGPMAEEFYDAFGLGVDEKHITGIDSDGVALAAIQGLSAKLDDAREEIAQKDERIEEQAERIDGLEAENERLRERLAAVEDHLGLGDSETTTQGVVDD